MGEVMRAQVGDCPAQILERCDQQGFGEATVPADPRGSGRRRLV